MLEAMVVRSLLNEIVACFHYQCDILYLRIIQQLHNIFLGVLDTARLLVGNIYF